MNIVACQPWLVDYDERLEQNEVSNKIPGFEVEYA